MLELSLSVPPHGVRKDAWATSSSDVPRVGDVWLLSWDGHVPGVVMLAAVEDGHVVGWPITLDPEAALWPAVRIHSERIGRDLTVWPQAATGLGNHLLHRNLGPLMSERAVALTREATRTGTEGPFPYERDDVSDEQRTAVISDLLSLYASLCFHEWPPSNGEDVLDREAFEAAGGTLPQVVEAIDVNVPQALRILDGVSPISVEQVSALAQAIGVEGVGLTRRMSGAGVNELLRPTHKDPLLKVMSARRVDEAGARSLAMSQFGLAARTDRPGTAEGRMTAALRRLAEREND